MAWIASRPVSTANVEAIIACDKGRMENRARELQRDEQSRQ
jgi:hypothetical protein